MSDELRYPPLRKNEAVELRMYGVRSSCAADARSIAERQALADGARWAVAGDPTFVTAAEASGPRWAVQVTCGVPRLRLL